MVIIHRTICDQMRDRIAVRLKGGGSLMRHSKNGDLETALSWFPRGVRVRRDLVVIEAGQATSPAGAAVSEGMAEVGSGSCCLFLPVGWWWSGGLAWSSSGLVCLYQFS